MFQKYIQQIQSRNQNKRFETKNQSKNLQSAKNQTFVFEKILLKKPSNEHLTK